MQIIWREYYNENAVAQLTAMGTLPRNEFELEDDAGMSGEDIAERIASDAYYNDSSCFREGGQIVIVEPAQHAGTYYIETEFRPSFYASREDD